MYILIFILSSSLDFCFLLRKSFMESFIENEKSDFRRGEKKKESWCNVCLGEFLRVRFNYEIFLRCNTRWFKR